MVRIQPTPLAALDAYVGRQPDPKPSRPEMIRKILEDRLVHEGLIQSDASLDGQIADQKAAIGSMPSHAQPSPEAGMAAMDKAIAENDLVDMKNERTRRRNNKRK